MMASSRGRLQAVVVVLQCLLIVSRAAASAGPLSNVDLALQELKRPLTEIPGIIGNWKLGTDAEPSGSDRKDAVCCHQQAIKLIRTLASSSHPHLRRSLLQAPTPRPPPAAGTTAAPKASPVAAAKGKALYGLLGIIPAAVIVVAIAFCCFCRWRANRRANWGRV